MLKGTLGKSSLLVTALCGILLLSASAPARANDHYREGKCEKRIHKAEEKLEKAIRRHGPYSRQAEHRRHELQEAREGCRVDRDGR